MAKKSIIGTSVVALSLLSAGTVAANTGVESTDSTNVTPSSVSAETTDNSLSSTTAITSSELETTSTDIKYGTITETVNTDTVVAETEFPVSTEFVEALKEREELIDRLMYSENPGSVQGVTVTPLDKASVENTTNRETLLNEGTQLMESKSYVPSSNTSDDEAVDILNITEEQRKELNLFATEIINSIRKQVGTTPVVTTQGMFNVANAVTNKINEVEASKPDRSGEKWDFNTEAHLYYTGYHYDAIYDAAVANGIRVETTKYPNTVAKNFGYQTEVSSGEYKDQKQSDMIVIKQDIAPSDILTMGQLKALVYDGFEKMIYKPSFASNINDDTTVTSRDYDHALGVTGLRRYRAEDYQPNTHVSTAITFIRQPWGDGVRKYTAQLHIFQESGNLQSDNYKNLKGSLAGIVDPTLYDKTPLTRTIIIGVPTQAPVVELPEAKEEKVIFDPNNKDHIEKIEDPTLPLGKEVIDREGKDGIDFVIKFGDQKTRYVKIALEKRVVRVGTLVTSEVTPEQPTGGSSEQPTGETSGDPTGGSSEQPTGETSGDPTGGTSEVPTGESSEQPTGGSSEQPTGETSGESSGEPTGETSGDPTGETSGDPTGGTSEVPTGESSEQPTGGSSGEPTGETSGETSGEPTGGTSEQPTSETSGEPTGGTSEVPTGESSEQPTGGTSEVPTGESSEQPTGGSSGEPTGETSGEPTGETSGETSGEPTGGTSEVPTGESSEQPTGGSSGEPTGETSVEPTGESSGEPTGESSGEPTGETSGEPTGESSGEPTGGTSEQPTGEPTGETSGEPTGGTSEQPTGESPVEKSSTYSSTKNNSLPNTGETISIATVLGLSLLVATGYVSKRRSKDTK